MELYENAIPEDIKIILLNFIQEELSKRYEKCGVSEGYVWVSMEDYVSLIYFKKEELWISSAKNNEVLYSGRIMQCELTLNPSVMFDTVMLCIKSVTGRNLENMIVVNQTLLQMSERILCV